MCKSVFVNKPCVTKNSSVAISVSRRTELAVSCTRGAARDTMVIASPGPPHRVAYPNVERIRHKTNLVACGPYCDIENLAAGQPFAALHLMTLLIDNSDNWNNAPFSRRASDAIVIGLSYGRKCNRGGHCQPTGPL